MAFTYLVGVYLAVNAVRDLYLLVEGPDCTYMKAQYVQGNHDWMSTLTSVSGFHRIANTALHTDSMADSREGPLVAALRAMAENPAVPALALTSMPMAFVTGADYDRLVREVAEASGKPVVQVPGKSLSGDWLDGYAEVLYGLAKQLDLGGGRADPRSVAVVGYLHDRNEEDHAANVRELRRMLDALDLELASVWLSGEPFEELYRVRDAGTVISLPYGRKAARQVARRTGARLVELPLPFGLDASQRWMRELGEIFERRDRAEAYIDGELRRIVPKLEWVIPFLFQNRRVGYVGDPHLLPGLLDIVDTVGAELASIVITNRPNHATELPKHLEGPDLLVFPKMKAMVQYLEAKAETETDALSLLVTHNMGIVTDTPILEFGFPSVFRHALFERPFLGFAGALAFVDSMANAIRMREAELAMRQIKTSGVGGLLS
jgi:nitrogenase molybdenum-iron protein alpha/beta subunit